MMFQQSGYQQHINEYTTDDRTLLDHIYSNLPLQSTITGVSETYYSYRKGVYIAIDKGQLSYTMSLHLMCHLCQNTRII